MKIVLQKVKQASVQVNNKTVGHIGHGFLLFVGITHNDTLRDATWLIEKILKLRLFVDPTKAEEESTSFMEKNICEVGGELLVVSQFTLYGDCRKGTRPSFTEAAKPEIAQKLYNSFVQILKEKQVKVETGIFGAHMEINLLNDGPITLIIDSK